MPDDKRIFVDVLLVKLAAVLVMACLGLLLGGR